MTVLLTRDQVRSIEEHARDTYPEECCGILVGSISEPKRVFEVRRTRNVVEEDRGRRYLIDPRELLEASSSLPGTTQEIVGFYHSHPDHPASPSEVDVARSSWPGYSYLIVSVVGGLPREISAWLIDPETGSISRESVHVVPG